VSLKKDRIKAVAGSEAYVEVFTEEETDTILEQAGNGKKCCLRNRTNVNLLRYTGLRVSKLCSVRLEGVDRLGNVRCWPTNPQLSEERNPWVMPRRHANSF
jgi:site-specific recombinase XerD